MVDPEAQKNWTVCALLVPPKLHLLPRRLQTQSPSQGPARQGPRWPANGRSQQGAPGPAGITWPQPQVMCEGCWERVKAWCTGPCSLQPSTAGSPEGLYQKSLAPPRQAPCANVEAATAPQLVRLKECAVLINDM